MITDPAELDLELVDAIERANITGWPPTSVHELPDGWILRATPGLLRGRSNNALMPRLRELEDGELPLALERVRAWSALHGIRGGLQVTPLALHGAVVPGLVARGWEPDLDVCVMIADRDEALARAAGSDRPSSSVVSAHNAGASPSRDVPWICTPAPEPAWLDVWAVCRGGRTGLDAHVQTVFHNMDGRGHFGRLGHHATGVAVVSPDGEWAGLFSLVVREEARGRGLGRQLVISLLESVGAPRIYLQVERENTVAQRLYASLGFRTTHTYQHLRAPVGWSGA